MAALKRGAMEVDLIIEVDLIMLCGGVIWNGLIPMLQILTNLMMKNWIVSARPLGFLRDAIRSMTGGYLPKKCRWQDSVFTAPAVGLVTKGDGQFHSTSGLVQATAPFFFAVHPGQRASYGPIPKTTWEERFLTFDGPRAQEWLRCGLMPSHCKPVQIPPVCAEDAVLRHKQILAAIANHDPVSIDQAKTETEQWLLLLRAGAERADSENPAAVRIARLLKEWEAKPPVAVDLHAAAHLCGMSYPHWRAEFVKIAGIPPYRHLLTLRLQRAGRLLLETPLPVKEVSFLCGFRNIETFQRAFRDYSGLTPGNYRRQASATP